MTPGEMASLGVSVCIAASYVLALPLGWEREHHCRAYLGLRVFPLVAVGSCAYVFLAQQLLRGPDENESDVLQGLMTGIGLVGAAAIFKRSSDVRGVATAAALWTAAAIGASVAYGCWAIAISLSAVCWSILEVVRRLQRCPRERWRITHTRARSR
jgi:putative Mg2+ transporter-C (MgtC) family protein